MAEKKREEKTHSGNGKRKSRLSPRPTLESCSLFGRASLSFHASHSRVHTCTPRSILLSSGSTGIPPQLERAFIFPSRALRKRRGERERERSWPSLIEIMLIKSRRGGKKITRISSGSRSARESERDTRRFLTELALFAPSPRANFSFL